MIAMVRVQQYNQKCNLGCHHCGELLIEWWTIVGLSCYVQQVGHSCMGRTFEYVRLHIRSFFCMFRMQHSCIRQKRIRSVLVDSSVNILVYILVFLTLSRYCTLKSQKCLDQNGKITMTNFKTSCKFQFYLSFIFFVVPSIRISPSVENLIFLYGFNK